MTKEKILVSFSAGETSGYMCNFLKENYSDKYEFIFVFANTGEENEETLLFADKVDKHFNLGLVWVEALIVHEKGKGTKHTIVDYNSAARSGIDNSFEEMIIKYGIPNMQNMVCTRELKERPITSYARSIGWKRKDYRTAIGIRADEMGRVSENRVENRMFYPLVELIEVTKPMINSFWDKMPFRLNLKGYQGNCKWCWKKSDRKLGTLAKENPEYFDFVKAMELKYDDHVPSRDRDKLTFPIRFFRGFKSVEDVFDIQNGEKFNSATDDSVVEGDVCEIDVADGCEGSCEPFSNKKK